MKNNTVKLIDFYELTMSYSDIKNKKNEGRSYFDVFFRTIPDKGGYALSGGLDRIVAWLRDFRFTAEDIEYLRTVAGIDDEEFLTYLKNFKFQGDIDAVPDGTPIFPGEPCITVYANTVEAQILETDLLNRFNHSSLIMTKASRIVREAGSAGVMEFGARRAQGEAAAIEGAKCAYLAGCIGTSCYEAGKQYGIPLLGTMAHSHIMKYENEYDAFLAYAKTFPQNTILLVDTYDTIKSGIPNAIRVAREYLIPNGYRLKGIRLDSGDLAYLSKEARRLLDEAGLEDAKICVSNSLDEYLIRDLKSQGAPIDSYGVGENLITAKSQPVFGGVYKLAAMEENGVKTPKIKISENIGKTTNPAHKKIYRFYDRQTGEALGDVIALASEKIPLDTYTLVDALEPWKRKNLTNYHVRELQVPIYRRGELVYQVPTVQMTRQYCLNQLKTLSEEVKRLYNPHRYIVDLSLELAALKQELIESEKTRIEKSKVYRKESL